MASSRGPVPKRTSQRRRTNKSDVEVSEAAGVAAAVPEPDASWHPVARLWYESLGKSGQHVFFQSSDWATAYLLAESISRELNPQPMVVGQGKDAVVEMVSLPPKGASLSAWLKAMTSLLVTEGDRRRLRIELEKPAAADPDEIAAVASIDTWRDRLSS